jgi:hypothetical protein
MRKTLLIVLTSTLISLGSLLSGCSSKNETTNESQAAKSEQRAAAPKKETVALESKTGREAFQTLYAAARGWGRDSQPVRMDSRPVKTDKADGKASVWAAAFASSAQQSIRVFQWSGVNEEGSPEPGVSPGSTDTYNPGNASTRPFDFNFLKIDTDKALEVANKKGGAAVLKKDPDTRMRYKLEWDPAKSRLLWHVLYGINESDAKLQVWVNASTGDFVKVEK